MSETIVYKAKKISTDYIGEKVDTPEGSFLCTGVHVLEGDILLYFEDDDGVTKHFYLEELLLNVES